MNPNTAIQIQNLSKQYRLGLVGTGTLSHDLKRWWAVDVRGKEDPYLKLGEVNRRDSKGTSDYVWALKDINLEIEQGDVVGIIGKNGAGKSTLLKLLSRVTKPTTGSIAYRGRIASLLEVGTGFHPEMTGRENIYMNGAIMGMTRHEISRKLDEIIAFAGVERYIDTPVKRYSSGMTVRLGFAVAAHLEPDILVVDEVLAVGDAEFQKKAIGKMQDVSQKGGRTVLFVSHNMAAVKNLCGKGLLLVDGMIECIGNINTIVEKYLTIDKKETNLGLGERTIREGFLNATFQDIQLIVDGRISKTMIQTGSKVIVELIINCKKQIQNVHVFLSIYNNDGLQLIHTNTGLTLSNSFGLKKGENRVKCILKSVPLQVGNYYINLALDGDGVRQDRVERALEIEIVENNVYSTGKLQNRHQGIVILPNKWEV